MPIGPTMHSMSLGCAVSRTAILCHARMPAPQLALTMAIMLVAILLVLWFLYTRGGALSRNARTLLGCALNRAPTWRREGCRGFMTALHACIAVAYRWTMNVCEATCQYMNGYMGRVKATYRSMTTRPCTSPCIQVLDSPMPTGTPTTPRSSIAQRRGGTGKPKPRYRRYRILYNPQKQGECGYDCLLKIMKRRTTASERRSI